MHSSYGKSLAWESKEWSRLQNRNTISERGHEACSKPFFRLHISIQLLNEHDLGGDYLWLLFLAFKSKISLSGFWKRYEEKGGVFGGKMKRRKDWANREWGSGSGE